MTSTFKKLLAVAGLAIVLALLSPVSFAAKQTPWVERPRALYYLLRPDLRRCVSPLCGGYWIEAVNRKLTRCADGEWREACYVAEVDWDAIGLDGTEGATLVRGRQRLDEFPAFGALGVLVPQKAYRLATDAEPKGRWYGIQDNGIVCITFPCYSFDERLLNRSTKQPISGVDVDRVGADPDDEEAARRALAKGELIAVGRNVVVPDQGPAGDGITMVAKQFYLRVKRELDRTLYCRTDDDCTTSGFGSFVDSAEDCYCPVCPTPLNVNAARKNERSWLGSCQGFGYSVLGDTARFDCPKVLCTAPRPVACVDNQCVFADEPPGLDQR